MSYGRFHIIYGLQRLIISSFLPLALLSFLRRLSLGPEGKPLNWKWSTRWHQNIVFWVLSPHYTFGEKNPNLPLLWDDKAQSQVQVQWKLKFSLQVPRNIWCWISLRDREREWEREEKIAKICGTNNLKEWGERIIKVWKNLSLELLCEHI